MMNIKNLKEYTKQLSVLYVEDEKSLRESTLELLENFFQNVDTANDGVDGVSKFLAYEQNNAHCYDLIITDINMPKMNGVDMIKAIYKINHTQQILVLSAYNDSDKLQELMDIGITHYIHKPVNIKSLIVEFQKIREFIEIKEEVTREFTEIKNLNHELDALIESFNTYVIASRTDLKGIITYTSKAYEKISGYTASELIGKHHNLVRHPDMPSSAFKDMWSTIKSGKLWIGEVLNLRKDGSFYWVTAYVAPYYDKDGVHIGYSSIRTDITAQKEVEVLHSEVNNLLNNAGQGFLSFNANMKIHSSFSQECLTIFGVEDIANENIADILFANDAQKRELFVDGITRTLDTDEEMIKDMFLSLLPKEHKLNKKEISIEYKALQNTTFMLILTDITKTKLLEYKLQEQDRIQKMIVAVASNKNDFIELKHEFENFMINPSDNLRVLLRELHTYKGIFAQKEMLYITDSIHELESKINSTEDKKNALNIIDEYDLQTVFSKDLKIIASTLGEDFLSATYKISVNPQDLDSLELKIKALESICADNKLSEILEDIEQLRHESLFEMLSLYKIAVKQISQKLEKEVYPLEIIGDKNLLVTPKLKPFINSLIHLFNNCVEHGIEEIDTRLEKEKDEIGKLTCSFSKNSNTLQIIISDDGAGIDIEKLTASAKSKGISVDGEQTMLVFADSLSTKEQLTTTSGRGVGMSAIKSEVTKLGGSVEIKNKIGLGVEFIFRFKCLIKKGK